MWSKTGTNTSNMQGLRNEMVKNHLIVASDVIHLLGHRIRMV
jgi:hypothetical protein